MIQPPPKTPLEEAWNVYFQKKREYKYAKKMYERERAQLKWLKTPPFTDEDKEDK